MEGLFLYPNRTICSVLDEMRKCYEVRNFSGLMGLIEEVQILANRMEAGLNDEYDARLAHKKLTRLKTEVKELEAKKTQLGG